MWQMLFFGLFVHHGNESGQIETATVELFAVLGIHDGQSAIRIFCDAKTTVFATAGELKLLSADYFFSCFHVFGHNTPPLVELG
ncbi:TPA: hypothetical protein DCZ46_04335 [Candidatus Campbellbacteria bacterium]|nr:hypothetical protein [Candidatus Campbellbacteria bacterium]HBC71151.1 hypothetical protein [Candidatus Campbellbacteria bacterium]